MQWTPWTSALSWGELLGDYYLDETGDQVDDQQRRLAMVVIGHAVQDCAVSAGITTIAEPLDLSPVLLAPLADRLRLGFRGVLITPATGPGPDELGAAETRRLHGLLDGELPVRAEIAHLCARITRWHWDAEHRRDDATVEDRRQVALTARARAERAELLADVDRVLGDHP